MFSGEVIHGDGLGTLFGFPTANFDPSMLAISLDAGVYAARATYTDKTYDAALCVYRDMKKIEVHLLEYAGGDLYGEMLIIEPLDKISEFVECKDTRELVAKIAADIEKIKAYFRG